MDNWLQRGLAESGKSFLMEGSLCARGYLNPDSVNNFYASSEAGIQLLLLGAELWIRRWFDGDLNATASFAASAMQSPSSCRSVA